LGEGGGQYSRVKRVNLREKEKRKKYLAGKAHFYMRSTAGGLLTFRTKGKGDEVELFGSYP